MKCDQYWPDVGSSRQYDTVTVTAKSESIYAEFAVRELLVSKVGEVIFRLTVWRKEEYVAS